MPKTTLVRIASLLVLATVGIASTAQAQVAVSDTYTLDAKHPDGPYQSAGESQSTIIAPGLKAQCPKGTFLATREGLRGRIVGPVIGRDLDKTSGFTFEPTFTYHPTLKRSMSCEDKNDNADYVVGTDHDLVTLPNGDVLYIAAVCLKMPLTPKPDWFDTTFRGKFGPGARTGIMTWRSQDGGRTFQYLSLIDSAATDGGVPGYPQYRDKKTENGTPYDMGGSDGPQAMVDVASGKIYLTAKTEGYYPESAPGKTPFVLGKNWVNKTVLYTSTNGGASWTSLGLMDYSIWRLGSRRVIGNAAKEPLAFGATWGTSAMVWTAEKSAPLKYSATTPTQIATDAGWPGWGERDAQKNPIGNWATLAKNVYANIWANTVVARVPGSPGSIVVAYPAMIAGKGYGHRIFFYNTLTGDSNEGEPIVPVNPAGNKSCTMHLTVVDSEAADGKVMLYWYDLDAGKRTATIRGRVLLGDEEESNDFDISDPFDLTIAQRYWYGDYHTARGYYKPTTKTALVSGGGTSYFYPMWVQPDKTIRYAEVAYANVGKTKRPNFSEPILKGRIPQKEWVENRLSISRRIRPTTRLRPAANQMAPKELDLSQPQYNPFQLNPSVPQVPAGRP